MRAIKVSAGEIVAGRDGLDVTGLEHAVLAFDGVFIEQDVGPELRLLRQFHVPAAAFLEATKARGATIGRPRRLDVEAVLELQRQITQNGLTIVELCERTGISRPTLTRSLRRLRNEPAFADAVETG